MFKTRLLTAAFAFAAMILSAPATEEAHACTGSANDPSLCINNNQAINGYSSFYYRNLQNPCSGGSCSYSGNGYYGSSSSYSDYYGGSSSIYGRGSSIYNSTISSPQYQEYMRQVYQHYMRQWRQQSGGTTTGTGTPGPGYANTGCGATGDCSAAPGGSFYGSGPNGGYLCDAGGTGCGSDRYVPNIPDTAFSGAAPGSVGPDGRIRPVTSLTLRSRLRDGLTSVPENQGTTGGQPAGTDTEAPNSLSSFVGVSRQFNNIVDNHPYRNNLTDGAFDPFGGGEGVFVDPRTGEASSFDESNPPEDIKKAKQLNEAYIDGKINYPFYEKWRTRPQSDFDPNGRNLGGVKPRSSIVGQLDDRPLFPGATTGGTAGSAHSTTESGTRDPRRNPDNNNPLASFGETGNIDDYVSDFFERRLDELLGTSTASAGTTAGN